MGQMSKVRHLVVRDIKDPKMNVAIETRYLSQQIMGDIELLEIDQLGQAGYFRNPVGLYGKDFQVLEG